MCGRAYETYTDEELYFHYLDKTPITEFPFASPIYNLCPTMNSPVLRLVAGERRFDQMHWQLIPEFEPTFKTKLSTINAKSETVFRSPLYRDLVVRQRLHHRVQRILRVEEGCRTKAPLQDPPPG